MIACGDVELNPGPDVDTPGNASRMVNQPKTNSPINGLQIGEWNVNNLTDAKFEQIKLFLTSTHNNLQVLFLIETFLQHKIPDSVYEIPGYSMHRKERTGGKKGGGLLAYVRNQLIADRLDDL